MEARVRVRPRDLNGGIAEPQRPYAARRRALRRCGGCWTLILFTFAPVRSGPVPQQQLHVTSGKVPRLLPLSHAAGPPASSSASFPLPLPQGGAVPRALRRAPTLPCGALRRVRYGHHVTVLGVRAQRAAMPWAIFDVSPSSSLGQAVHAQGMRACTARPGWGLLDFLARAVRSKGRARGARVCVEGAANPCEAPWMGGQHDPGLGGMCTRCAQLHSWRLIPRLVCARDPPPSPPACTLPTAVLHPLPHPPTPP